MLQYVVAVQILIVSLYGLGFLLTVAGSLSAVGTARRAYGRDDEGRRLRYLTFDNLDDVIEAVSVKGWFYLSLILGGGLLSTIASVISVFA